MAKLQSRCAASIRKKHYAVLCELCALTVMADLPLVLCARLRVWSRSPWQYHWRSLVSIMAIPFRRVQIGPFGSELLFLLSKGVHKDEESKAKVQDS